MDFSIGDLVKYVPSPSATFKWERYTAAFKSLPGVILREIKSQSTSPRRFEIRWHDGQISEEWISHLDLFDNSLTT
jgi:hypothetical protein